MTNPTFNTAEVEAAITGTGFHTRLMHFPIVGSTNQLALEAANAGARGGVWIADEQTAGRGRGGHAWHSAPGDGLYVSALVTPRIPLSFATSLPLHTGLAVQAAVLEVTGLNLDIRWPNDLMFGNLKCGGILVESAAATDGSEPTWLPQHRPPLKYAVIGIGLNLNHPVFPPELAHLATSLKIESGRDFTREPILAAILRHLDEEMKLVRKGFLGTDNGPDVRSRLQGASSWVSGKRVRVGADEHGFGGYTGWTRGLDASGFLLVEADDGTLQTVLSGGVRSAK
jgi:BirA family biotin operon repressor/biotin-[acetyl-CoA-carboxylase] ligase